MSTVKRKITGSKSLFTLGSPSPIANTTLSESATKRSLISCAKLWWATNSLTVAIPLQWGRFALNPSPGPARRWWTSEANAGIPSERSAGRPWTPWSVLLGAEFVVFLFSLTLVLSPSIRQLFEVKTSLFEWKHCHISLKWWLFHPITLYEQKKVPFDDISWQLESERTRARGKSNHKFLALDLVPSPEAVDILALMFVARIVILESVEVVKRSERRNYRKCSTGMIKFYCCLSGVLRGSVILKGSLDSISSPSVKIQIICGKFCLRCKDKTSSNDLPLHPSRS